MGKRSLSSKRLFSFVCLLAVFAGSMFRTTTRPTDQHKRAPAVAAILAFAVLIFGAALAKADGGPFVRVMTQNMDNGDLSALARARTPAEFFAAVTTTYQNILNTKPAERAAAMAREIATQQPDLVAVQEASIIRTGSAGPALTVRMDLLQSLRDALVALDQHYEVIAIVPGADAQVPSTLGFDVRFTGQDAILVRTHGNLALSNLQIQHFGINTAVPNPFGSAGVDTRGWASIDVTRGGRTFRFVTTHLASADPPTNLAQAGELLLSAGNTTLPVILVGDLNTTADSPSDPSFATYQALINAGFLDAWQQRRAPDPGFTCCQAPDLHNPVSLLNHRIDLVLLRGAFGIVDVNLIGNNEIDRTSSGLWPSDHAGVVATLRVPDTSD